VPYVRSRCGAPKAAGSYGMALAERRWPTPMRSRVSSGGSHAMRESEIPALPSPLRSCSWWEEDGSECSLIEEGGKFYLYRNRNGVTYALAEALTNEEENP
jgi:hypothetical protein